MELWGLTAANVSKGQKTTVRAMPTFPSNAGAMETGQGERRQDGRAEREGDLIILRPE